MNKLLKGFALSFSMLSIIPFFRVHDFYKGINGYAVMFYPLVGFILGSILFLISVAFDSFFVDFHLGIIIFFLWVLFTGALHLDGFSDTVDGLFVQKERALKVMKDPHNGGMGMIFSVVFLMLKASSLIALNDYLLLPVILLLSRLVIVFVIYFYSYISVNGMGSLAKEELTKSELIAAFVYSGIILYIFNAWLLLLLAFMVMFFIKYFFIKRYGGFSGDIYGFTIEVIELFLLNFAILGLV